MMNFKQFLESSLNLKIHEPWHLNHHHEQDDYALYATIPNENGEDMVIGRLLYSVYQDKPLINMVEVSPEYQKQGIGKKLIARLTQDYPYEQIKWGYMTEPGYALKKSYERNQS